MGSNTKLWNVTLEDVCSYDNAKEARRICFKNQKKGRGKQYFSDDANLFALADSILIDIPPHQGVRNFIHTDKYSGKKRLIAVPTVRDKIIMHMLIVALKPLMIGFWEERIIDGVPKNIRRDGYLIRHTLASIEERGIEFGRKCLKHWARTGGASVKYVVKWDLEKYYDSVDVLAFIRWLKKRIKDKRVIRLWWIYLYEKKKGLVIGSPLSQWAANLIFGPIGHWITRHPHVSHHLQYMDDGIALLPSKRKAIKFREELIEQCEKIGLTVKMAGKGSIRVWRWRDAPIDMIGYKTYRSGFQELRGAIYLSARRLMARIERNGRPSKRQARSLLSRKGFVQHSDCKRLHKQIIDYIDQYKIKEIAYENHNERVSTL